MRAELETTIDGQQAKKYLARLRATRKKEIKPLAAPLFSLFFFFFFDVHAEGVQQKHVYTTTCGAKKKKGKLSQLVRF